MPIFLHWRSPVERVRLPGSGHVLGGEPIRPRRRARWRPAPGTVAAAGAVAILALVAAGAEEERRLSIMAVMHKQYTVSKAPFVLIQKELDSESPDWEKVQAATKRFVILAEALAKNEPRRGSRESWRRLIDRHLGDARAMDDGAAARDRPAVRLAHRRLATSCKACHDAHRFRRGD
jgi:cytochrome c556